MGSPVSLVRSGTSQNEIDQAVRKAIDLIEFKPNSRINSVVIKPNLCYYWGSSTGSTTDPAVVSALIDWVRDNCGNDVDVKIAEADASAMRTKHVFRALGYQRLADRKNVKLINLSEDVLFDKSVRVNGKEMSFKIPGVLQNSDLIVNVPKLKIMRATKITCAMKNIFGANGFVKKVSYHNLLDEAIVGMNTLVRPHLTVVDGLVALGKSPKRMNLIMAGKDGFSVDWVASQIMGYEPTTVRFLNIAMKGGTWTSDGITARGESVNEFARVFPREGAVATKYLWSVQFFLLKAYQRLSGDIIPPVLEEG